MYICLENSLWRILKRGVNRLVKIFKGEWNHLSSVKWYGTSFKRLRLDRNKSLKMQFKKKIWCVKKAVIKCQTWEVSSWEETCDAGSDQRAAELHAVPGPDQWQRTAPTADRDLPQAPPQLPQSWLSDLISSGSTPVNLSNPFLNPFILLALQKVAPPSLLQAAAVAHGLLLNRGCSLFLTAMLPFSASLLAQCYDFWVGILKLSAMLRL